MTKKPKKKTKMPHAKDETFERMKELTRRIVAVPKSELPTKKRGETRQHRKKGGRRGS